MAPRNTVQQGRQADGEKRRQHAVQALLVDPACGSRHVYAKWRGAFWRLTTLVDLGVDASDTRVIDMADAVLDWLASPPRRARLESATVHGRVHGRVRWCASQEGLALWAVTRLGRAGGDRVRLIAEQLVASQWPDGGWNCDKRPEVTHSSFHETHGPLRGLAAYHEATGDPDAFRAAWRAADFLLAHRLYRSCRTGDVANPEFAKLHWPAYWHYDILVGLRGIAGVGGLERREAGDALDVLEGARRPDGTWRTGGRRHWRPPGRPGSNVESADLSDVADIVVTAQATRLLEFAGRVPALERTAVDVPI